MVILDQKKEGKDIPFLSKNLVSIPWMLPSDSWNYRGMRVERVKEDGIGRFPVYALHAVGSWNDSLYIAAYGDEDKILQNYLDHLNYLIGLMERQIIGEDEGLVRFNLLAFKSALEDVADRMEEMEKEGMEAQLLVKLLPTWNVEETMEAWEGEAYRGYEC